MAFFHSRLKSELFKGSKIGIGFLLSDAGDASARMLELPTLILMHITGQKNPLENQARHLEVKR